MQEPTIATRLQELNKWQEEQKKMLNERQNIQRKLLGLEQRNMYHMLGLLHPTSESESDGKDNKAKSTANNAQAPEPTETAAAAAAENVGKAAAAAAAVEDDDDDECTQATALTQKTSGYSTDEPSTDVALRKHTKRTYLKRGEGLKQRFKIHPDELRLDNLPRYKYASSHPSLTSLRSRSSSDTARSQLTDRSKESNNNNNNNLNNNQQKPLTLHAPHSPHAPHAPQFDLQEKRFQQLLLSSQNACSSTPDAKSVLSTESSATLQMARFAQLSRELIAASSTVTANSSEQSLATIAMGIDKQLPISWAKVLDSQQIKPKNVHEIRTTSASLAICTNNNNNNVNNNNNNIENDLDNISLFELLEQRAKEGSFDANSSCIRNYMRRKMLEQQQKIDVDEFPIDEQLKKCGLEPKVDHVFRRSGGSDGGGSGGGGIDDNDGGDDSKCDKSIETSSSTSTTSSSDNDDDDDSGEHDEHGVENNNSNNNNNNSSTQQTTNSSGNATANTPTKDAAAPSEKACYRVRFTDDESSTNAPMANATSETSTLVANDSTMNNSEMFQQFKDALFSALQSRAEQVVNEIDTAGVLQTAISNVAVMPPNAANVPPVVINDDLQEKTNLMKMRLTELEHEIATFKENNLQLTKAKQEHALQKAQFEQERFEMVERLNDEKIQLEIYLHDERMKIEDEKRKFEQKVRTFKNSQTAIERKEVLRLKQDLDELQLQLKHKEQQHVTAQARLRAKVRNLEKDQKQLLDDIEQLKKENKRLENENARISRENNNKMLHEINRNIAKLAPKLTPLTTCLDEAAEQKKSTTVSNASTSTSSSKKPEAAIKTEQPSRKSLPTTKSEVASSSSTAKETREKKTRDSGAGGDTSINAILPIGEDEIVDDSHHSSGNDSSIINAHMHAHPSKSAPHNTKSSVNASEFKREIINADGSKDIWYPNGNLKKVSADAMNIRMLYFNKDIKETNIHEGTVKYYYADTNTWHTTYLDGLEILEFPNGQTEHRYKDGTVEVHFPNNTIKVTNPSDDHRLEEWRFADGTNLLELRNGDRILMFPNGQKEIHTKLNKRREYPDGTVKLVYPDGSQETRYSNGRVRLKDKDGKLIMDTVNHNQ